MHRFLLYNGEIRDTGDALVSPGQTGYMNGWGVFSTIRVYDGVLFAYPRHYERMRRDAALMHVPFPLSPAELEQSLLSLVRANGAFNATLRVAFVRNRGGLFQADTIKRDADLVAFTADLAPWGDGVKLYYVPHGRHAASPFAGTKVTSWAQNLTWYEEAHDRGFDEVILLNEFGQVSECTSANIFAISGNHVWTPPVRSSGCLPGVTRCLLLEEIKTPEFTIGERDLMPQDLEAADQVFITSTTRNLLPVLEIQGRSMRQRPDAMRVLSRAFEAYQANYAASHARPETVRV
jgi:branched-chain amino acid aminotransferase